MNSFEKFSEEKLPDRHEFHSFLKDGCINEKVEHISEKYGYDSKEDGHISEEDYFYAVNVRNKYKNRCVVID